MSEKPMQQVAQLTAVHDASAPQSGSTVLEMRNISKTFGAVKALRDVNLDVRAGEVHALMGENGAGKSTLMKVLSGAYKADPGGTILINGLPRQEAKGEVAVIYQELSLAPNLTVGENMFLGREISSAGIVNRRASLERAQIILDRLNVRFNSRTKVSELSLGERQMVEIARALTTNARLIVMDEPTTSLSSRETERLFDVIAQLKSEGIAIIYISHRMEEIYALSDRCSVLRDGVYVGTLERDEIDAPKLISMMVGRDIATFYKKAHSEVDRSGEPVLRVENLSDNRMVKGISFDLYRGEVLGVAGLVGSGRTEMARLIFGADPKKSGHITLNGRVVDMASPRQALDAGIAYLTEDRKKLGLFLDMSISENVNIGVVAKDARPGGLLNFARAAQRAAEAITKLGVKTPSANKNVGGLSGGNQQKVLIARLLETGPDVVILDEPTRGVDVGAKSEIYKLIDNLAASGVSVILISSELAEIIGTSDRVMVMHEGVITGEITATAEEPITQEKIMALSTGSGSKTKA
ncbi:sugar ABC transporter ATP-binding protein [Ochrobactrum sp. MYb379]|uniref:sugar ABC transporter ATP-binding protein n=1 Tax=Ochrobactrum sp. MYb379 TaxID=2745275 RepID=UPI00403F00CB